MVANPSTFWTFKSHILTFENFKKTIAKSKEISGKNNDINYEIKFKKGWLTPPPLVAFKSRVSALKTS